MAPRDISRRRFIEETLEAGMALGFAGACARISQPSPADSPRAWLRSSGGDLPLSHDAISASWRVDAGVLLGGAATAAVTGVSIRLAESSFALVLADGTTLDANAFRLIRPPSNESLAGNAHASRAAERVGGQALVAT